MYKIIAMLVFQILMGTVLYFFPNIWILFIMQFIFSIFLVLIDNAVSVNYHNIGALNENIEKLIKYIAVYQNKVKNENLDEKWFDVEDK